MHAELWLKWMSAVVKSSAILFVSLSPVSRIFRLFTYLFNSSVAYEELRKSLKMSDYLFRGTWLPLTITLNNIGPPILFFHYLHILTEWPLTSCICRGKSCTAYDGRTTPRTMTPGSRRLTWTTAERCYWPISVPWRRRRPRKALWVPSRC